MSLALKFVLPAAAAALLASAAPRTALAQPSPRTDAERMERALRDERERRRRAEDEWWRIHDLRMAGEPHRAPKRPEPQLALAQIKEDFMRIQVLNNDLTQMVARSNREPLDLKLVSKSAADIRKRAARLRDNLILPDFEKVFEIPKVEAPTEAERLRSSLTVLRRLILGFVNNPHFKHSRLVDVQAAIKARRDLDDIIEVSGWVKQSSEKLHKADQKSH
jgi:hypothetical protein